MSHNHNHPPLIILGRYEISHDCLERHFTHAHGHGGQNVNKVATKVQLVLHLDHLHFPEEMTAKLRESFPNGKVEVSAQESRSQHENVVTATEKMKNAIEEALK